MTLSIAQRAAVGSIRAMAFYERAHGQATLVYWESILGVYVCVYELWEPSERPREREKSRRPRAQLAESEFAISWARQHSSTTSLPECTALTGPLEAKNLLSSSPAQILQATMPVHGPLGRMRAFCKLLATDSRPISLHPNVGSRHSLAETCRSTSAGRETCFGAV